jgi:hypothetical protein
MLLDSISLVLAPALAVNALPQQTASPVFASTARSTTSPPAVIITPSPLSCSDGSTVLTTTDCTVGKTISYCYSPPPPIQCSTGSFPGVWHPGHCLTEQTCYPLNAPWITSECSNGGIPYATSTLYEGTLAGGDTTTISGKIDRFRFFITCLTLSSF